ncbi:hypothetical protein [Cellulosimicrobium sp. Marseille-Q8652]
MSLPGRYISALRAVELEEPSAAHLRLELEHADDLDATVRQYERDVQAFDMEAVHGRVGARTSAEACLAHAKRRLVDLLAKDEME